MLKKFIKGSDLIPNIMTLVFGTFLAQLIPILLQSVLRRIYTAEDFGAIAVFISITSIFVMFSTLRYEIAINLPKKKADAVNLVFLSLFFSFVFNIILFLIIFFFNKTIVNLINLSPQHSYILYFSPLSIFLFSTYQTINYYLVREKAFGDISKNKVSRRMAEGIVQTGFGFLKNPYGLLIGDIAGHITHNLAALYQAIKKGFTFRLFSVRRQIELAIEYKEFPLVNLFPSFLNAICLNIVVIFISIFYSSEIVGYFDLTRLVLAVPAMMLTLSISQVLLQNVTQKRNNSESIKNDIKKLLIGLSFVGTTMVIVILLIAPWAFKLYAGEAYRISGVFSQILVPAAALKIIVSPISIVFIALKKIKIISIWQISNFVLLCSLYFFRHLEIVDFLKVYVAIDIISYSVFFLLIINLIKKYEQSIKK
ncbi:MAG: lipopolysaccharide biosynthesis protein [Bacteroidota bacterium]